MPAIPCSLVPIYICLVGQYDTHMSKAAPIQGYLQSSSTGDVAVDVKGVAAVIGVRTKTYRR